MYATLESVIPSLEKEGFVIKDPWDVVDAFEKKVAAYAGSQYAVSLDNCTNAIVLGLKYLNYKGGITLPKNTYMSVPATIINAGGFVKFKDIEWSGMYQLYPTPIYDSATRFRKGMYIQGSYQCLSFHKKKILGIGKGGMILTNDKDAYDWFKIARYEGRHMDVPCAEDTFDMIGWNMYMPPEQAAYGIALFNQLPDYNEDCGSSEIYHDISIFDVYRKGLTQ
jgi:dTDP-4-amino-4,6-dideoxygalactose transaminase